MSILSEAENAVLEALRISGASPLGLEFPMYRRELRAEEMLEGNLIAIQLDKKGYRRYKNRYRKKSAPPPAEKARIKKCFNSTFDRFRVLSVQDCGDHIKIIMESVIYGDNGKNI